LNDSGFSLVETLVAFAIFSLSTVAILQSHSASARTNMRASSISEATLLAREVLLLTETGALTSGERTGTTSSGATWRVEARELNERLTRLTATVQTPGAPEVQIDTVRWHDEIAAVAP